MKYALTLPSVYIDATKTSYRGKEYVLIGALIVSCRNDIQRYFCQIRAKENYFKELHFNDLSTKEKSSSIVIKKFIDVLFTGECNFRALLIEDNKSILKGYFSGDEWKRKAARINLLASYPFFTRDDIIFKHLLRPRIFIDEENLCCEDEKKFKDYLIKKFETPPVFNKGSIHLKDRPDPIIGFVDSKLLDQLQLVDVLLGCVRISYEHKDLHPTNAVKQDIFQHLLKGLNNKTKKGVVTLRGLNRRDTGGLINVWEYSSKV